MNTLTRALAAAVFGACLAGPASATVVAFPDFSDTTGLTLNGSAATTVTGDGTVLRLTPAALSQSGSAFSSATINAATFSTFFSFRISSRGGTLFDCNTVTGADGLVFVVQSVSSSIGGAGQGIGYSGIGNSVGVEWDTWCNAFNNDPSSNHLGIDVNGNVNHGAGSPNTANISPDFDDGEVWFGWVDYDGTTLEARTNKTGVRPAAAGLSRVLDIPTILGQSTAFVGFTSGTGADFGNHDIISWEYRDTFDPIGRIPEPSIVLLLAIALAACALIRNRAVTRAG